jgi:hypothetical protein
VSNGVEHIAGRSSSSASIPVSQIDLRHGDDLRSLACRGICKARHSKAIEGKGVYAQSEPNGLVRTVTARMAGDGIRTSMRKIALGLGSKFVDRTGALPSTRVCWRPEDEKEKKKKGDEGRK